LKGIFVSAETKKQRATGRPEGSKNIDRAEVAVSRVAEPCPQCGEPVVLNNRRKIREGDASGTHKGIPYGYYRLYIGNCNCCSRAIKQFEYDYITDGKSEVCIDPQTELDS
jgi:hypothetical protein